MTRSTPERTTGDQTITIHAKDPKRGMTPQEMRAISWGASSTGNQETCRVRAVVGVRGQIKKITVTYFQ